MPFGYATGVALIGGVTVLALLGPSRPRWLASAAHLLTVALNEYPAAFALALAASTVATVVGGALTGVGWAVVALGAAVIAGLGVVALRGVRARRRVAAALQADLGSRGRATELSRLRIGPAARQLLAPLPLRGPGIERISDVSYGDEGRHHRLDIYRLRDLAQPGPVLIHFHGGRFRSGAKSRQARPLIHALARRGWVCISANYRLLPARHPAQLIDAKRVIAWVRSHSQRLCADPRILIAAGSSAGGHMAASAALTAGDPHLQPGFEASDTSIAGVVCLGGYFGSRGSDRPRSSPRDHIREDAPPFFIAHGDHDTVVPVESAREFAGQLRETSRSPVVYAELEGGQHSFDLLASPRFCAVVAGIEVFVGAAVGVGNT